MNPRVKMVVALAGHRLRLKFDNGEVGVYDCTPLLTFGVFRDLADIRYFRQAAAAYGTVVWPNGQDLCPDTLYLDSERKSAVEGQARRQPDIRPGAVAVVCEKANPYMRGCERKSVPRKSGAKSTGRTSS